MTEGAKIWVEALESGKYRQREGMLGRPETGMCCLGLACHLALEHGVIDSPHISTDIDLSSMPKVTNWLGLATAWAEYEEVHTLANDNDSGKTFKEIAEIIKSEPEGLFRSGEAQ